MIGHTTQRAALKQLAQQRKLPHALIFSGPSGVGKYLAALEITQLLVCQSANACLNCESCKSLAQGSYPDLHIIDCANREHSAVDNIRQILKRLQLSKFNKDSSRVIILREAEYLSIQTANLLLKSVEEPGSATFFILITQNAARLPATLRSRCQPWFFNTLSLDELSQICRNKQSLSDFNPTELSSILQLADGSAENLESLSQETTAWQEVKVTLDRIALGDGSLAISYAQELASNKEQLKSHLRLMRIYLGQKLRTTPNSQASEQAAYSIALTNIISAERLIFERNLSAATVLAYSLLALTPDSHLHSKSNLPNSCGLLEKVVVG